MKHPETELSRTLKSIKLDDVIVASGVIRVNGEYVLKLNVSSKEAAEELKIKYPNSVIDVIGEK